MIGKQTIKKYCCEDISLIENFDIAVNSPDKWDCHHRKEIENGRIVSVKELKEQGLYYNRPAEELIFLSKIEHMSLHHKGKSGERNPMYGKHCSEEHKMKIGESMKGKFINRKDQSKSVICVETGEVFESMRDAQRKTGIRHISEACHGNCKTAGGYHWKFYN